MASITLIVDDAVATRVVDAICNQFGYNERLEDGSVNPETKNQFTKRMIAWHVKNLVVSYETRSGETSARATSESQIIIS